MPLNGVDLDRNKNVGTRPEAQPRLETPAVRIVTRVLSVLKS